jgi:hypothetical protein
MADAGMQEGTPLALWLDLVREGERRAGLSLGESVESYVVFVLMRHLRDGALAGRILVLEWLQALEQVGRARADALRDVGDRCLLIAGRYPGLAERRRVGPAYYADLGRGAYHGVAETARDGYAALYAELAGAFGAMVRVLAALPDRDVPVLLPSASPGLAAQVAGRGRCVLH